MRKFFLFSVFLICTLTNAQELNCMVTVNYDKITNANNQIFKTLQTSLNDFVNKTAWTEQEYKQNEKINCAMFITINAYDSNQYQATLQVQSSRPIYDSAYSSPILNINDKDFSFKYVEFENLVYNPNSFDSNLMSVLAFYSYLIIASDVESFIPNGGSDYFQKAQEIVALAASSGYKGWSQSEGNQNKFFLINDILSPNLTAYREFLFSYHFDGLDQMNKDVKKAKEEMKASLMNVSKIYDVRPSSYLLRTFFDAKADEIVSVFSGGPSIPITDLLEKLNKVSPTNATKWSQIKF